MPHDVIMPALGMAQVSGLIVAWHKAAGEAVAADDVLFEVETDKTTMEVPAGASGFVAALLAAAGDEVPVGEVIAVISAEKPAAPEQAPQKAKPAPVTQAPTAESAPASPPISPPVAKPAAPTAPAKTQAPVVTGGKILASPKARRLAAEQGLDLARLAASGVPMPYHVADLETLRALPATATGTAAASLHVTARVPQSGFAAFLAAVGDRASRSAILASFAAASLRAVTRADSLDIRVEDRPLADQPEMFHDPDLGPISAASAASPAEGHPHLVLRDLTGGRITGGVFGTESTLTLTLASDGESLALTLDFTAGNLGAEAAIRLLDGFAGRLEDPLRHLL